MRSPRSDAVLRRGSTVVSCSGRALCHSLRVYRAGRGSEQTVRQAERRMCRRETGLKWHGRVREGHDARDGTARIDVGRKSEVQGREGRRRRSSPPVVERGPGRLSEAPAARALSRSQALSGHAVIGSETTIDAVRRGCGSAKQQSSEPPRPLSHALPPSASQRARVIRGCATPLGLEPLHAHVTPSCCEQESAEKRATLLLAAAARVKWCAACRVGGHCTAAADQTSLLRLSHQAQRLLVDASIGHWRVMSGAGALLG